MNDSSASGLAAEEELASLMLGLDPSAAGSLARVEELLVRYPADPRLHFLKGMLLAGAREYAAGQLAMNEAVALAPNFHLARYQLGFLRLISGDTAAAEQTWEPLRRLPEEDPLNTISRGLVHLTRDEVDQAITNLEEGIRQNFAHPAIYRDVKLILDRLRELPTLASGQEMPVDEPFSAVQLMLKQARSKAALH